MNPTNPRPAPPSTTIDDDFLLVRRHSEHEPESPAAAAARQVTLAKAHVKNGELPAAADAAAEAVRLNPQSPDAQAMLGAVQLDMGELYAAFDHLLERELLGHVLLGGPADLGVDDAVRGKILDRLARQPGVKPSTVCMTATVCANVSR